MNETVDVIYNRFMYPEGIKAMAESVNMVAEGKAPKITQPKEGSSYDPYLNKSELCLIDFSWPAKRIHDFIRGLDSNPGARAKINGKEIKFYGSKRWSGDLPVNTKPINIDGSPFPGLIHEEGLIIQGSDKKALNISLLNIDGRFVKAAKFGENETASQIIDLTVDELKIKDLLKNIWSNILKRDIEDNIDFFGAGAGNTRCPPTRVINDKS